MGEYTDLCYVVSQQFLFKKKKVYEKKVKISQLFEWGIALFYLT